MKTVVSKSKTMVFGAFAAAAVILFLGTGMALAEPPAPGRDMHMREEGFWMRGLDLSESQKDSIRGIFEDFRNSSKEIADRLNDEIRELAPKPTEEARSGVEKDMAEMLFRGTKAHYDAFRILTPEQRTKLADRMNNGPRGGREIGKEREKVLRERLIRELDLTSTQQKKLAGMKLEEHDPGEGIPPMIRDLDLTAEQEGRIREILKKHRDDREGRPGSMEKMKELHGISLSDTFDGKKAAGLTSAIAEDMVGGILERKSLDTEIMQILTDTQKEKFRHMEDRFPVGVPFFDRPEPAPERP